MNREPVRNKAPHQHPPRAHGRGGRGIRWFILLVLLAVAAALLWYGVKELRQRRVAEEIAPFETVFAPNITINGTSISGMTPQQALDTLTQQMNAQLNSWSLNLTYRGHRFTTLTYPLLGMTFSPEQLYPYLNEAWQLTHVGDVFARKQALEARAENPYNANTQAGTASADMVDAYLASIAPYINRPPQDAVLLGFNPDSVNAPFSFQQEQVGLTLDIQAAREDILALAASGQSGDYELQPAPVPPNVTVSDLNKQVALRATAQTSISTRSTENRNNNIRVAFSRFNGMVLKNGQEFSFNRIVGPRDYKSGFFDADEIAYGEYVTGVGGGVCQASSTLYQAALMAGMTITDRTAHSDPVNYTDKGLDATVFYSRDRKIDFKFRNKTGGDVYIAAHVTQAGNNAKKLMCTIRIYGPSLGDQVTYRLRTEILETLQYVGEPIYRQDKNHEYVTYVDETKKINDAKEGYVVATYLQKFEGATMVEEHRVTTDTYAAKAPEYWRGTMRR